MVIIRTLPLRLKRATDVIWLKEPDGSVFTVS